MIGTTPIHTFSLPFDKSFIDKVRIIYKQGGNVILKKETEDCTIDGNTVTVKLTQQETFLFSPGEIVRIQLRVLTSGNEALKSNVIHKAASECLDDEVLE